MEYADGGNLGEYFQKCEPPRTAEDVISFWKSLFQVFHGLERVHQLRLYDEEYVGGWVLPFFFFFSGTLNSQEDNE